MEIIQSIDSVEIAFLNRDIQILHNSMYPWRFKEFDFGPVNDFFKNMIGSENHYFFIIKDNSQALGYIWFEIREYQENAFLNAYKSIFVHHLSIAIEYQNQGLGKQLMNKVRDFANERDIKRIELDYWSSNESAKKFYEKIGFNTYREFVYRDLE
jgi:ribosomal protein S18 acetylase RimI-like enzyme